MGKLPTVLMIVIMSAALQTPGCSLFDAGDQSSPEKVVEAYLEALKAGDLETMFRLTVIRQGNSEDEQFIRNLIEVIELQHFRIESVEKLSKREALVSVTVTFFFYGRESKRVNQVRVVKDGSSWLIHEWQLK